MIKTWIISLEKTSSTIILNNNNNVITLEPSKSNQQSSYNLPDRSTSSNDKCFSFLKENNVITHIGGYKAGATGYNNIYILSDDYELELGTGIKLITKISSKQRKNIFILKGESTEESTRSPVKAQLKKSVLIQTLKKDTSDIINGIDIDKLSTKYDFQWFDQLYNQAMYPGNVLMILDMENKKLTFDYEIILNSEDNEKVDLNLDSTIHAQNIIFYGAPGTGKSYGIKQYIKEETYLDIDMCGDERVFRTTLHPEYSYSDFVGQVMPIVKEKDKLTYEFVPGIFTQALKYAYENPNEPVFLILEEMSRANCAAVFGDIFQLLDRDDNGNSEYAINNMQIADYIFKKTTKKIVIPSNLYIIGTMNTSDQNVYVMDTAFKRRFLMKYEPTKVDKSQNQFNIPFNNKNSSLPWNTFVEKVNSYIVSNEGLNLSEDKQIGQFFMKGKTVSYNQLDNNEEQIESRVAEDSSDYTTVLDCNKKIYNDKVLYYLYHDVEKASYNNQKHLFKNDIQSFGELYNRVSNDNYDIYSDEFLKIISLPGDDDDK